MDEKDIILEVVSSRETKFDKEKVSEKRVSFHSNPILKKLFAFNNKKFKEKFSLKDIFR